MSTRVHLLGPPHVERDGEVLPPPRGNKSWALLAYLTRTPVPATREQISTLLFPEAADPLAALRWTLSDLRRTVGRSVEVGGDPLELTRAAGTVVDVDVLHRGSWREALDLPGLGRDLLCGLRFSTSTRFQNWLESERRHATAAAGAVLHEAALSLLAYGETSEAVRCAVQLVDLEPFDENAHALLVRCLRRAGDLDGARREIAACEDLFRRELGIDPSPAVRAAGLGQVPEPQGSLGSSRAAVHAQIEAGEAALAAGASAAGLERIRSACAAARAHGEPEMLAGALISLGGALVHGARGTDEEGTAALHEGVVIAERSGYSQLAATGWREIAWVQFLRARYRRAEESAARATALADDEENLAWAEVIVGMGRMDTGDYATAGELLRSSVRRAHRTGTAQLTAFTLSALGRYHWARGDVDAARTAFDDALAVVELRGLTAFRPWPESSRGEIDLRDGNLESARRRFEHAYAIGREVGDPCWQSVAMRGLGLVAEAEGDVERGLACLLQAPRLCRRLPDTYLWIEAYGLDALCAFGVSHGAESVALWIDELGAVAAERGMRELLLHAAVYRARLGEPGALGVAQSLAEQVDNPAVDDLLGALTAA